MILLLFDKIQDRLDSAFPPVWSKNIIWEKIFNISRLSMLWFGAGNNYVL